MMREKIVDIAKKNIPKVRSSLKGRLNDMLLTCRKATFLCDIKTNEYRVIYGDDLILNQKTRITGKGQVKIGNGCRFGSKLGGHHYRGMCELQPRYENSKIVIGSNVSSNNNLFLCAADEIAIGNNTIIGENVMLLDHDGHGIHPKDRRCSIGKMAAVRVGKNVWIGSRVTILAGTVIGNNCIIGAGAVVKGNYPDNVIIAGNPAKIVRKISIV